MHVIATVGTDPLAVLVALHRVCERLGKGECSGVMLLCSADTVKQAERIKELLTTKLSFVLPEFEIRPCDIGTPADITRAVRDVVVRFGDEIWLDFTGGRKSMGQWAQLAIAKETGEEPPLSYVYVEHSGEQGSKTHAVIDENGQRVDPSVGDERRELALSLNGLARLHGYSVAVAPQPGAYEVAAARAMVENLCVLENRKEFATKLKGWSLDDPWPWLPHPTTSWSGVPDLLNRFTDRAAKFLHKNRWLEIYAWNQLSLALDVIGWARSTVAMSCTFKRANEPKGKDCEIDVVAIFGYQLLVISCGTTTNEPEIKGKAFEIIHRARQIGGGSARAICLSMIDERRAPEVQDDLADLLGVERAGVTVWGIDKLPRLSEHFAGYLSREMHLKKESKV